MTKEIIKEALKVLGIWVLIIVWIALLDSSGYSFFEMTKNVFQLMTKGSI